MHIYVQCMFIHKCTGTGHCAWSDHWCHQVMMYVACRMTFTFVIIVHYCVFAVFFQCPYNHISAKLELCAKQRHNSILHCLQNTGMWPRLQTPRPTPCQSLLRAGPTHLTMQDYQLISKWKWNASHRQQTVTDVNQYTTIPSTFLVFATVFVFFAEVLWFFLSLMLLALFRLHYLLNQQV